MAWTKYQLSLAAMMLVTGSINTLSAKWADNFSASGCHGSASHSFSHPFLQAVGMFLGELSCLVLFHLLLCRDRVSDSSPSPDHQFHSWLFLPPALCDMTATSLMYVALNMTSASSFQMLRGAVIIFTGLLSVAFLNRRLAASQWLGILVTILGLVLVGLADFVSGKRDESHKLSEVITGDLLIIMAQIIAAVQVVLEEKFVYKHDVHPLRAVGTEGLFGFIILSLLLIPMFYIPVGGFSNNPRHVLEDALDAFCQIANQPMIVLALLGNIISIAFFNFAGISVTKEMSATTRMVLDSLRTVVIWALSLALGWEHFHALQVFGFIILLTGAALYNNLHRPLLDRVMCCAQYQHQQQEAEEQAEAQVVQENISEREKLLPRNC